VLLAFTLAAGLALAALPAHATFPGKNGRVAYRADANQIYLTTSGQLTFPAVGQYDFGPAFSPDGSKIAFVRQNVVSGSYYYDVMVVNSDGTGLKGIFGSYRFSDLTAFSSVITPAWTADGHGHPLNGLKVQVRNRDTNAIITA
jgi:hypothetical protein